MGYDSDDCKKAFVVVWFFFPVTAIIMVDVFCFFNYFFKLGFIFMSLSAREGKEGAKSMSAKIIWGTGVGV